MFPSKAPKCCGHSQDLRFRGTNRLICTQRSCVWSHQTPALHLGQAAPSASLHSRCRAVKRRGIQFNDVVTCSAKRDVEASVEELFTNKFGPSIVEQALRGNDSYNTLIQQLQQASPADQARFHEYAKGVLSSMKLSDPSILEYVNNANSAGEETATPDAGMFEGMFNESAFEDQLKAVRSSLQSLHDSFDSPNAEAQRVTGEHIASIFTREELDLMFKLTGINWATWEVTQPNWRTFQDLVASMSLQEVGMLADIMYKVQSMKPQQEAAAKRKFGSGLGRKGGSNTPSSPPPQQAASASQNNSTSSSSPAPIPLEVVEPIVLTPSGQRQADASSSAQTTNSSAQTTNGVHAPNDSFDSRGSSVQQSEASSSMQEQHEGIGPEAFRYMLQLLENPPADVQTELHRYLDNEQLAESGKLFAMPMSRHMKVITQVFREMLILAEAQQGLPTNFTPEQLDFKSSMMARTLADLFASVQEGQVEDPAALCTLKFINSQLLQQEDGALFMWSDGEEAAIVVATLHQFITASRNVQVMGDFLAAYTGAVQDDLMALKAQRLFEAWADETWWIKDIRDLNEEESQRWAELKLVSPDEVAIELLAGLDTDLLVFLTERLKRPMDDVTRKWIHHPIIGPGMVDGSVLETGVPEVWEVVYYLASRDRTGEFDTMADITNKQQSSMAGVE